MKTIRDAAIMTLLVGGYAMQAHAIETPVFNNFVAESVEPVQLTQVVNPADSQHQPTSTMSVPSAQPLPTLFPQHLRTFELPAVQVLGESPSNLKDEDKVGSYGQPRWTATRRFPGTRVYVVPEGKVELEYWARPVVGQDGNTDTRQLFECEIGLPHRFQLDLYFRTDSDGDKGQSLIGTQFEVRYALADWGVLPGNPTLYFEYINLEERPDKIEPKILFGGELAERWHWGLNFIAELEMGGSREHEYSVTGGISYTVIDSELYVGVETIYAIVDEAGNRGDFVTELDFGPSIQWKPLPQMAINFAPLFGVTSESPVAKIFLNLTWEL